MPGIMRNTNLVKEPGDVPSCNGNDVIISLSPSQKDTLILDSTHLKQASRFFEASLAKSWSLNKTITDGTSTDSPKMRFELELSKDGKDWFLIGKKSETPFKQRHDAMRRFNINGHRVDSEGLQCGSEKNPFSDVVRGYKVFFSLICNRKVRSPNNCVRHLAEVVCLADAYSCFPVVVRRIEQCLVQSNFSSVQSVHDFEAIAEYPCFYLLLAARLRSRLVYEEAIRHAVGKWDSLAKEQRNSLDEDLRKKVLSVRERLMAKIANVQEQIRQLRIWDFDETPKSWLATAIFKDWALRTICQGSMYNSPTWKKSALHLKQLIEDPNPKTFDFFTGDGSSTGRFDVFLAVVNKGSVDRRIQELVSDASDIARPFLEGYPGELPAKARQRNGDCYFTHCKIQSEDLPWVEGSP